MTDRMEDCRIFERSGSVLLKMWSCGVRETHVWYRMSSCMSLDMQTLKDVYIVTECGEIVTFFVVTEKGDSSLTWGVRKRAGFVPTAGENVFRDADAILQCNGASYTSICL